MRKILLGALALVTSAFFFGSAQADMAISGFFQQIIGMGDDTTGGITHEFDRINFNASTTTDNGWEVGGTLQHEPTLDRTAGPTTLSMYVTNNLGTVVIGNTTDAVTNTMISCGGYGTRWRNRCRISISLLLVVVHKVTGVFV